MTEHRPPARGGLSAAFFDLDRTLISGSSAFVLALCARSAGLLPTHQLVRDAVGALTFKLRGSTDRRSDEVRDRILGAVKGMRPDDLVGLNAEVVPKLLAKIRPESRRLLDLHRRAGRATYIVSAAPVELVQPLAQALGMTAGIGTVSRVTAGVYDGGLDGPFCYGAGKVTAMLPVVAAAGHDLAHCYAYSDSASDLPMLEAVGHPVAVNPDGKLTRHAQDQGWPIVHFSQRSKAVIRRSVTAAGTVAVAATSFAAGIRYAQAGPPRSAR